jgi:hypothetical protein
VDEGSKAIMQALESCLPIADISGEPGTKQEGCSEGPPGNVGTHGLAPGEIKIGTFLRWTLCPKKVRRPGGRICHGKRGGIAAMVKAESCRCKSLPGSFRRNSA